MTNRVTALATSTASVHTSETNNGTTLATPATNNKSDENMNKKAPNKCNWNFNSKLNIQQLEI